jgi:hypothetical protein
VIGTGKEIILVQIRHRARRGRAIPVINHTDTTAHRRVAVVHIRRVKPILLNPHLPRHGCKYVLNSRARVDYTVTNSVGWFQGEWLAHIRHLSFSFSLYNAFSPSEFNQQLKDAQIAPVSSD